MADAYNNRRVSSGWASDVYGSPPGPAMNRITDSVTKNNRQRDSFWDTPSQKRILDARSPQGNPSPRAYDSTIPEIVRYETRPLPQSYGPATQSSSQRSDIAPTLAGPSLPGYRDTDPGIMRNPPSIGPKPVPMPMLGVGGTDRSVPMPMLPGMKSMLEPMPMPPGMDTRPVPMPMPPGMDTRPVPMPMRPGMDARPKPAPMLPGMDARPKPALMLPGMDPRPKTMPMRPGMKTLMYNERPPDAVPTPQPQPDLSRLPGKAPRTWSQATFDALEGGAGIANAGLTALDAPNRYTWGAADQAFNVAGGKPIKYGNINPIDESVGMQFSDFVANRGLYPKNDKSKYELRDIPAFAADMLMDPLNLVPGLNVVNLGKKGYKGLRGGYNAARAMMR